MRTEVMEATAYSSDWRSCGWEWGLALGPLPLYLPLCCGRRPSGTVAVPLLPRWRREKADSKIDCVAGAVACALAGATGVLAHALMHNVEGRVRLGVLGGGLKMKLAAAVMVGGAVGGAQMPLGRYWAETHLKGLVYAGSTAAGVQPREARPGLLQAWRTPATFLRRLVTLQWGSVDGTIAADTR